MKPRARTGLVDPHWEGREEGRRKQRKKEEEGRIKH
jgi:hypothetical protein